MIFDRLTEFTEAQQKALLFMKNADPDFEMNSMDWQEYKHAQEKMKKRKVVKRFKKGCSVRIHGLKGKREWNGKNGNLMERNVPEWD